MSNPEQLESPARIDSADASTPGLAVLGSPPHEETKIEPELPSPPSVDARPPSAADAGVESARIAAEPDPPGTEVEPVEAATESEKYEGHFCHVTRY